MTMSEAADAAASLDAQYGDPPRLTFPEGWKLSGSWHRAQASPAHCGPVNAAEFDLLLGYPDRDGFGGRHRVLFAIYEGDLRAECDCDAYTFDGWCAHVAYLWWRWVRGNLGVVDLDTDRTHMAPPWWLSVQDADARPERADSQPTAAADGGTRR